MARSVFFSFHYQRDIWRVNVVRNHFMTKKGYNISGYWDHSLWETAKKTSSIALKRMINKGLEGTSVTVILIGYETWKRPWVKYEIEKSYERGNAIIGIYIHNLKNQYGYKDDKGQNPLDNFYDLKTNRSLAKLYPTYDWLHNCGYQNFGSWVEQAAILARR